MTNKYIYIAYDIQYAMIRKSLREIQRYNTYKLDLIQLWHMINFR